MREPLWSSSLLWMWSLFHLLAGSFGTPWAAERGRVTMSSKLFLSSAWNDALLKTESKARETFFESNGDTPLLREIETRAALDNKLAQKYSLRFSPRGWGETSALKALEVSIPELASSRFLTRLHAALKQRYSWIALHQYLQKELSLTQEMMELKAGFVKIYRAFIKGGKLQVLEIAEAEEKMDELLFKERKLKSEISELEQRMAQAMESPERNTEEKVPKGLPGNFRIAWHLPKPEKMKEIAIKLLDRTREVTHLPPSLAEKQAQLKTQAIETDLVTSERKRWISFIEFSAEIEKHGSGKFTGEIAFPIPWVASDRLKEGIKRSELVRSEGLVTHAVEDAQKTLKELGERLRHAVSDYSRFSHSDHSSRLSQYLSTYKKRASFDVLTTQKIKQMVTERQIKLNELAHETSMLYLELLDALGALSRSPFINYFSSNLEELDEGA